MVLQTLLLANAKITDMMTVMGRMLHQQKILELLRLRFSEVKVLMICHQLLPGAMIEGDVLTVNSEVAQGDMDSNIDLKKS